MLPQTRSYTASADIPKCRIVKFGAADGTVVLAAAATDASIGVSSELSVLSGEPCDVERFGLVDVEFGGTVTRGDPLTADANGKAVAAAPAAGTRVRIIGFAEQSAVAGDIALMQIAPGYMTTPAA